MSDTHRIARARRAGRAALPALAAAALLAAAGCAYSSTSGSTTSTTSVGVATTSTGVAAGAVAPDTSLEGRFAWVDVDGRPAPADFPPGSGAALLDGTLELRDVAGARAGTGGRFGLRFGLRPTPADTARPTSQDGRFRVLGDSLHFTPDGREDRPPVRFRYAWRPDGTLALTDAQGHVWSYVRR